MRIATPVTGLVIEAIQNSVSGAIGRFAATSAKPLASRCTTRSLVTTAVTAPGYFPFRDHVVHRLADAGQRRPTGQGRERGRERKDDGEALACS